LGGLIASIGVAIAAVVPLSVAVGLKSSTGTQAPWSAIKTIRLLS
jgi:hypothetical protein